MLSISHRSRSPVLNSKALDGVGALRDYTPDCEYFYTFISYYQSCLAYIMYKPTEILPYPTLRRVVRVIFHRCNTCARAGVRPSAVLPYGMNVDKDDQSCRLNTWEL